MYGIFTYIYPKNHPNVGKYTIHGASGNPMGPTKYRHHFQQSKAQSLKAWPPV